MCKLASLSLGAALFLTLQGSSCTVDQQAKVIVSEAAACDTVTNGLKGIEPFIVKLDAKGRRALDDARGLAAKWCSDPNNPPSNVAQASADLIASGGRIGGLVTAFQGAK